MKTAHRNHATHEDPMGTKICELPEWRRPSRFPWFFSSPNLSGLRAFVVQPDSGGSDWIRPLKFFCEPKPGYAAPTGLTYILPGPYPGRRCALPWAIILPSLQDSWRSDVEN